MLSNVTNQDDLQPGLVLDHRYVIETVIDRGSFVQVYSVKDLSCQKPCFLTQFIFRNAGQREIVLYELEKKFPPSINQGQFGGIAPPEELFGEGGRLLILQKTFEGTPTQELQRSLLPLNEYVVVQLLNQVLPALNDGEVTNLQNDLHDLALTALILLTGQYFYDSESNSWDWTKSKQISDQRKDVLTRMLGSGQRFNNIEEVLSALNAVFLPVKTLDFSIPRYLYIAVLGIVIGISFIVIGVRRLWISSPPKIDGGSPSSSNVLQCPEGSGFVAIACGVEVTDIDSFNFEQGKLTVKLKGKATANDRLFISEQLISANESGANNNNSTSNDVLVDNQVIGNFTGGIGTQPLEITFNKNANAEKVRILLSNILYKNISETPQPGERIVEFKITDGDGGTSKVLTQIISVNKVNSVPLLTVPKTKTVKEDGQIIITGISVKDDDAGDNNITVTLQTNNGSITVKDNVNNGLTWRDIREDKPGVIILNGTVSQINNTLKDKQALTYQTQTDFNGIDTLTVTINDNGKSASNPEAIIYPPGALNYQTDSKVININIEPLNDHPQLSRSQLGSSPNKPPDREISPTTPTPYPDQPNIQRLTKQQAVNAVESWLKVKAQAFGNTYNEQVVYQYTTDGYRDKQLGKVGWLRRNNAYEIWVTPSVEPLGDVLDRGNEVVINIQARESVTRYQGGVLAPNYTRSLSGTYRFTLQLDDGIWKVANSEEIN
jgi:hypothetical protein